MKSSTIQARVLFYAILSSLPQVHMRSSTICLWLLLLVSAWRCCTNRQSHTHLLKQADEEEDAIPSPQLGGV